MRVGFIRRGPRWAMLCGAAWLAFAVPAAYAQHRLFGGWKAEPCPPAPCETAAPAPAPKLETPPKIDQPLVPLEPSLSVAQAAAVGGETVALADSAVGYIDQAVPRTRLRLRFDAAWDDNRPDRAEFFYAKCGCFRGAPPPFTDPNASGPPLPETRVDYQDIRTYLEVAPTDRFSAFLELPVRFLNPEVNDNTAGFGDLDAGIKLALIAHRDRYLTFQFRTYVPTGDADRGLGTDHVSLEPGLLLYRQLTDRLLLEGELKDWIPIDGTDFAGNVLRWGFGLSYNLSRCEDRLLAPVAELVGWNVLGGKESDGLTGLVQDANHDTIINAKIGVRAGGERNTVYVGYGRALTGDVWYKDIFRVEYRLSF